MLCHTGYMALFTALQCKLFTSWWPEPSVKDYQMCLFSRLWRLSFCRCCSFWLAIALWPFSQFDIDASCCELTYFCPSSCLATALRREMSRRKIHQLSPSCQRTLIRTRSLSHSSWLKSFTFNCLQQSEKCKTANTRNGRGDSENGDSSAGT